MKPKLKLDLNCDLGEGEPPARTRALMRWITSANVACGGHAGDVRSMTACVRWAREFGVKLGAHPGLSERKNFGRGEVDLSPDEFELLLLQQVGVCERIARAQGVRLHHVKLHGSLYHASERDAALGRRYVRAVGRWWPGVKIYARAGGKVVRWARRAGVPVWAEAFADRAYREDGSLVPREAAGALLSWPREVVDRASVLVEQGIVYAVTGKPLRLSAQTLCVHADTPGAAELARALAGVLRI